MNSAQSIGLQIRLSQAQMEYLATRFPQEDPEIALVKLLERDRLKSLHQATANVQVLHLQPAAKTTNQTGSESSPEIVLPVESENPIGALQEYCQQKQLLFPVYEFETIADGFRCIVQALEQSASGSGQSKKVAKFEAAANLLKQP
jgi:dsRNA-specific ribonuclease